ncbi:putative tRNA (adenine(37)-N6)-methyltransferase [Desulfosporosinus acididurans]|uniref:Putative tRNA (Adenine(37)-N6)-methyltransferase n=1 Tax=Desulfosporosinus acididurans TaxID=476652 RepID=A0A0J1FP50_9FIRM|nr:tRNA (N6-threonylcarbamoyladenosine(37)-N6)-methyltransferase TrmO [Desulfosporosinus acididurans]KLU65082.1 putative tRNA (adenine(37)-N6)-methyltransferase [Desulfosporosinus acididurans]
MDINYHPIGTIHTPYFSFNAPHQSLPDAPGDFWITLNPEYAQALKSLDSFNYVYVLYHLDQVNSPLELLTHSPWAPELEIGLFASRSPKRPNPIGLSIVKIKEIQGSEIIISGIDAFNGTPLLDIKPYIQFRDNVEDANNGWFDSLPDKDHKIAHALGRPHHHDSEDGDGDGHEHSHGHVHRHNHDHDHDHNHDHDHDHNHDHDHDHDHNHSHSHSHSHSHPHNHYRFHSEHND